MEAVPQMAASADADIALWRNNHARPRARNQLTRPTEAVCYGLRLLQRGRCTALLI